MAIYFLQNGDSYATDSSGAIKAYTNRKDAQSTGLKPVRVSTPVYRERGRNTLHKTRKGLTKPIQVAI